MDVKLMMQTEVAEVYEPYAHGRGSSSTMPQKRNPISSCYIHAQVSVVRQHAAALMDAMVADHERSTGPWEIEWIVLPEAFCLMAGALKQTRFVLEGLEAVRRRRAGLREALDGAAAQQIRELVEIETGRRELWKELMPADPAGVDGPALIARADQPDVGRTGGRGAETDADGARHGAQLLLV